MAGGIALFAFDDSHLRIASLPLRRRPTTERQHDQLVATLVAQQHLKEYTLKFIVEDSKTHRIVRTLQDQKQIEQSIYLLNSPAD